MPDCDTTTNAGSSSSFAVNNSKSIKKTDKLKVLALHGYRQTGDSFKSKIGSFRKYLNKYVEFVFVTAPHVAPVEADDPGNSWWFNKDDGSFKGTNTGGPAIGFEKSLRCVEEVWNTQGPFQGILGFSQGACFAGLLCSLAERGMTPINPRFALLASGFKSGSLAHRNFYEQKIQIPSLHIYGETDEIIPKNMNLELAECFEEPSILSHQGGHYFPATTQQKQIYIDFFQDQLQDYLEAKEIAEASLANTIELKTGEDDDFDSDTELDQ